LLKVRAGLEKQLGKRTPYYHPSVPFVVLWAQKCGCTSVFKWFLWHAGLLDEALDYRVHEEGLSIHNYELEVFRKTPGYTGKIAAAIEAGRPIINFLRCPYSRAFSSYMHLQNRFFVRFERDGIRNAGLDLRYEILRSIYGKVTPVEYPVSFMDYLLWLDAHNVEEVEVHHASQYTPLYDLPNVTHYRLEDFSDSIDSIERRFSLRDSSAERSRFSSPHHLQKSAVDRQSVIRLLERGIPLNRSPHLSIPDVHRELLAGTQFGDLIERIFHKDIALYQSVGN
jgi:hypothetical protein